MANKKKLKSNASQQAKAGNLSSKLVSRLESAGVKNSVVDRFRNQNQAAIRSSSSAPATTPDPAQAQRQSKPLTGNPIKDGRYGYGAQKEAQKNYKTLTEQGVTDAFNPGKPGSYGNSMADGFFNKKELAKFGQRKDLDSSQARRRIVNKGGSLTAGANKMADKDFAKNDPFLAMMINSGANPYGVLNAKTGNKGRDQQRALYTGSSNYDYSNRLPDEVFTFRPNGEVVGRRPVPNTKRLDKIFSNPLPGDPPPGDEDSDKTDETDKTEVSQTDLNVTSGTVNPETTDPGAGMMAGGGMGAMGASKLLRARTRLQRLGILNRGTGLFGRGLQYGNTINA